MLVENKGEIDINSLILMGGSTKRQNKEQIGRYGSGNKYALSYFLRNKVDIKIFQGLKEIDIRTVPVILRDTAFNKIIINGIETSLTDSMGPDWKCWQAIREIVCNAIDESDYNIVSSTEIVNTEEGRTRFYIELTESVLEVINNWDSFFSLDRTDCIHSDDKIKVYPRLLEKSGTIYRKGIKCYDNTLDSIWDYDIDELEINEERLISSTYYAAISIEKMLKETTNVNIIKEFFEKTSKNELLIEDSLSWFSKEMSNKDLFYSVIANKDLIVRHVAGHYMDVFNQHNFYLISSSLATYISIHFPEKTIYGLSSKNSSSHFVIRQENTSKENLILKKALDFFKEINYNVSFGIKIAKFTDYRILGTVTDNFIILSERVFDLGVREVVLTIIEENEHLFTGYNDCTREFQNHLFNLFLKSKEEMHAAFL
jgi:hypothetical protein